MTIGLRKALLGKVDVLVLLRQEERQRVSDVLSIANRDGDFLGRALGG
jgi:hypothetical protein